MDTDERLLDLALRLTDGVPLGDLDLNALPPEQRALIERLRQVEAMSRLHKSDVGPAVHDSIRASADANSDSAVTWGPLEIREKIGRGAYGDVYRAWDPRLGREVALKLLRHREKPGSGASTLVREGHLLARVRHPNVVHVYGADTIEGRTGLWMELVEGESLDQRLAQSGSLEEIEVIRLGLALCDAVGAVHGAGLLHRDIKPQNVMRARDGRTVLMDLGTGQDLEEREIRPELAGTPLFLAPEVLAGETPTKRSDVYSLGVLLWYAATGRYPVEGTSTRDIRRGHSRRARTVGPRGVSRNLSKVLNRATHEDPEQRYPDAWELAAAMRSLYRQVARQRRAVLTAGILVAISISIGSIWVLWSGIIRPVDLALAKHVPRDTRLLFVSGNSRFATCTPTGSRAVAICDLIAGSARILRMPEDGDERSREALLSPDGRSVAYVWEEGVSTRRRRTLRVSDTDGSRDRALHGPSASDLSIFQWRAGPWLLGRIADTTTGSRVVLFHVDGREPTVLRKDTPGEWTHSAQLSGDRTRLFFVSHKIPVVSTSSVKVLNLKTGSEQILIDDAWGPISGLFLAPTEDALIFVRRQTSRLTLFRQSLVGDRAEGAPVPLSEIAMEAFVHGFTAEGALLVSRSTSHWNVLRMRLDPEKAKNSSAKTLGDGMPVSEGRSAQWSTEFGPNGPVAPVQERLAFVTSDKTGSAKLMVQKGNGVLERQIPLPISYDSFLALRWSPNGDQLAVLSKTDDAFAIHIADRDLKFRFRRPPHRAQITDARWVSPTELLLASPRGLYWLNPFAEAEPPPYAPAIGWRLTHFSPVDESNTFAVLEQRDEVEPACVLRIVTGDNARERHTFPGASCGALSWSAGAQILSVAVSHKSPTRSDARHSYIWLMSPFDGDPVRVYSSGEPVVDLSLTSTGHHLLFTTGDPRLEVLWYTGLFARTE